METWKIYKKDITDKDSTKIKGILEESNCINESLKNTFDDMVSLDMINHYIIFGSFDQMIYTNIPMTKIEINRKIDQD